MWAGDAGWVGCRCALVCERAKWNYDNDGDVYKRYHKFITSSCQRQIPQLKWTVGFYWHSKACSFPFSSYENAIWKRLKYLCGFFFLFFFLLHSTCIVQSNLSHSHSHSQTVWVRYFLLFLLYLVIIPPTTNGTSFCLPLYLYAHIKHIKIQYHASNLT